MSDILRPFADSETVPDLRRGDWVLSHAGDVYRIGSPPYYARGAWWCWAQQWYPAVPRLGGRWRVCLAKMRPCSEPEEYGEWVRVGRERQKAELIERFRNLKERI